MWVILLLAVASLARADALVKVYVDGKKRDFSPAARVRAGTAYGPCKPRYAGMPSRKRC